jgi:hypothetical protein
MVRTSGIHDLDSRSEVDDDAGKSRRENLLSSRRRGDSAPLSAFAMPQATMDLSCQRDTEGYGHRLFWNIFCQSKYRL